MKNYSALLFFLFGTLSSIGLTAQSISGPTSVTLNQTVQYSYNAGTVFPSYVWYFGNSNGQLVSTSVTGTTYYANVKWVFAGASSISFSAFGTTRSTLNVTVNCTTFPSAPTITSAPPVCGSGSTTLTASSGSGGTTVRWYSASVGGSPLTTSTSFTTPSISSTTTYYISSYNGTTGCESTSARVAVTAYVNPVPGAPTGTGATICAAGTANLSGTPGANGSTLRWYSAISGGSPLATSISYSPNVSSTTTFYISSYSVSIR